MSSTPQSPEPKGSVVTITSLEQFETEIKRSDVVTCVTAFTTYCPISSSEAVYDAFTGIAGEVEFAAKVQFARFDVALVPEVTKIMAIRALPFTAVYWEGECLQSVTGGNFEKIKLAIRHAYQTKYVAVTEREKAEKEKKTGDEGGVSGAAKSSTRSGSKPSTPSGGTRRTSSTGRTSISGRTSSSRAKK